MPRYIENWVFVESKCMVQPAEYEVSGMLGCTLTVEATSFLQVLGEVP
jgi:hypothetical protein